MLVAANGASGSDTMDTIKPAPMPMDEIRTFSHEDIEGPEEQEEFVTDRCDMLTENSDEDSPPCPPLAPSVPPPYPIMSSAAASSHHGVTDATSTVAGGPRNNHYPQAAYSSSNSSRMGPAPAACTSTASAAGGMPGVHPMASRQEQRQQDPSAVRTSTFGPQQPAAPLRSPPPPPGRPPSNGQDIKPFHRGPPHATEGWNHPPPHAYPGQPPPQGGAMGYPLARRHRPGSLDLPPEVGGHPQMNGGPPGRYGPACYMPRPPHGEYPICPPNGPMPPHPMMYRGRPPHMGPMMMHGGQMMVHAPASGMPGDQQYGKRPHIKKPLNAFMLFMKEQRSKVVAECTLRESAAINQILGKKWHSLTRQEQAKYYDMAREERQQHQRMYPNYNPRDAYCGMGPRRGRRQRRGDRLDNDEVTQLKKCRARYGLEHQEKWCKPCRRKKKCVKFTSADDTQSDDDENSSKREREGRGPDSNKEEDSDSDSDDDKSILSAQSYQSSDEGEEGDHVPHYNEEEMDEVELSHLISPTHPNGGGSGIAVLANANAAYPAFSDDMGLFSEKDLIDFPVLPPPAVAAAATTPSMQRTLNQDLDLNAMPGSEMVLAPTPAPGDKDVPLSYNATPRISASGSTGDVSKDTSSSLTPLTTPERPNVDASAEGAEKTPVNRSSLASASSCGEKEEPVKHGTPMAVLSMPGS